VSTVGYEVHDGVGVITLNRPEAQNTVNLQLAQDLDTVTAQLEDVRAVLLTGAGDTFCSGGDLKEFGDREDKAEHIHTVVRHLHRAIERIDALDRPVVAAGRGAAAGAGLGLACAADIVLASPTARFVSAYTKVGLSPDGSTSYALPRLVGLRRALELVLTNRVLDAHEALEWGIVTRIVDDASLDDDAMTAARSLATGPTSALGRARRLVRDSFGRTLLHQLDMEAEALVASASHSNATEGIAAFREKRPASFSTD
jgi:2-(1,2-epoxy-1,2-dihydrophenyl)acetyl-CoA isomerase